MIDIWGGKLGQPLLETDLGWANSQTQKQQIKKCVGVAEFPQMIK
jgi:hypothetical protein